ncbi:MAG: response regulator transcription factor [Pseudomonadota bacterium]
MTGKPILLADDHPLFRAALRQAVQGAAPEREVIETSSLGEARAAIKARGPGLLCLDLHMSDSDGFAGLIALRQEWPALPVAIVSGSEEPSVARRAISFGASAFVPKSLDVEDIRVAIAAVLDGETWTPANFGATEDPAEAALADRLASLTPAQLKVLLHVRAGLLNKQIAYEMSISEATVKAHMTAILRKLEVQTRTQAVLAAGALIAEPDAPKDDA